jgi:hypothetical protein
VNDEEEYMDPVEYQEEIDCWITYYSGNGESCILFLRGRY